MTPWLIGLLDPKAKYITQLELLAVPLLLSSAPWLFRGQQLLWFIDNLGALGAMVKAASRAADCAALAMTTHCALAAFDVELWGEWVDSDANPADGFSRLGWSDPFVQSLRNLQPLAPIAASEYIWEPIFARRWARIYEYYRAAAREGSEH